VHILGTRAHDMCSSTVLYMWNLYALCKVADLLFNGGYEDGRVAVDTGNPDDTWQTICYADDCRRDKHVFLEDLCPEGTSCGLQVFRVNVTRNRKSTIVVLGSLRLMRYKDSK